MSQIGKYGLGFSKKHADQYFLHTETLPSHMKRQELLHESQAQFLQ